MVTQPNQQRRQQQQAPTPQQRQQLTQPKQPVAAASKHSTSNNNNNKPTWTKPKSASVSSFPVSATGVVSSSDFPALGGATTTMRTVAPPSNPATADPQAQQQQHPRKRKPATLTIASKIQNAATVQQQETKKSKPKKKKLQSGQKPSVPPILASQKKKEAVVRMIDAHHSAATLALGGPLAARTVDVKAAAAAGGGHFDFLRMYGSGSNKNNSNNSQVVVKKGRQRVGPRKKKFSSLKKKVLEQRLRQWKELHAPDVSSSVDHGTETKSGDDSATAAAANGNKFTTVCLYGYCQPDELEDDDEYEEIVENLRDMATKIGSTKRVFVPRSSSSSMRTSLEEEISDDNWPTFVEFANNDGDDDDHDPQATKAAVAAVACWHGLVLGGQELKCRPVFSGTSTTTDNNSTAAAGGGGDNAANAPESDEDWQEWCVSNELSWHAASSNLQLLDVPMEDASRTTDVFLENALTEDDLEDEDCMEESLADIRTLASKLGQVESIVAELSTSPPCVRITFVGDEDVGRRAVAELGRVVMGGQQVSARLSLSSDETESGGEDGRDNYILLRNVLTEDDLEDEDCLEESLNDVRELALQFGTVQNVALDAGEPVPGGDNVLRIVFSTADEAKNGVVGFNGMTIGGQTVSAYLPTGASDGLKADGLAGDSGLPEEDDSTKPMYSGDKIIPERFAECKRVPKIVNSQGTRQYATLAKDETVKPLLAEMLGELMRLQRRAAEEKNSKAKRRIVMGLREVARGIRSHKVKLVVMANNLDEYGAIDEKLQEIIDSAHSEDVPVFYEFSKRTLG